MKTVANKKGSISRDGQSASKKPTIVRLDPVLKKKLKHIGIEQDKSLNSIIEEALVDYLKRYEKP